MNDPQNMPSLSEAQMEIMNIVWDQPETTLGEIWRELGSRRKIARNTIQTLLSRLVDKGWLDYRAEGKVFHYRAAVPRQSTMQHVVSRLVETAFNGSAEGLVMALLDGQELKEDEVEEDPRPDRERQEVATVMFLQQFYPGDSITSFLIRVLLEITLVTGVALLFGRVAVRRNPALRHGVCICALLCVLFAPITTFGLQSLGWQTLQISLESERQPVSSVGSADGASMESSVPTRPGPFWTMERAREAASLTILLWLGGSLFLLFRLIGGVRRVSRLRESAHHVDHPKLESALKQLDGTGRIPRAPIRFSRRIHSPIVVGFLRSTVILPEKLLDHLNEDQLRCVLAHELTHVRQRDPLVGLVQRVVEASYWPHPLVHFLNRDLVRAREEVCDNAALHGTTAPQYADTLLTVALGLSPRRAAIPGGVGLMTTPWRLEERVKGLLDPQRRLTTTMNTRHLALMAISLASGIALIAGARVVAAPNPPSFQDVVELHTSVNPKTNKVTVTAKTIKHRTVKVAKSVQAWTKTIPNVLYRVRYADPKPIKLKVNAVDPTRIYFKSGDISKPQVSQVIRDQTIHIDSLQLTQAVADAVAKGQTTTGVSVAGSDRLTLPAEVGDSPTVTLSKSADGKTISSYTITTTADAQKPLGQSVVTPPTEVNGRTVLSVPLTVNPSTSTVTVVQDPNSTAQLYTLKSDPTGKDPRVLYVQSSADKTQVKVQPLKETQISDYYLKSVPVKEHQTVEYYLKSGSDPVRVQWKENPFVLKNFQTRTIDIKPQPVHKPTTVYIKGGDIKIVGDEIRVVYEKADTVKSKKTTKTGNEKPKTKG